VARPLSSRWACCTATPAVVEDVAGLVMTAVDHGDADPGRDLHQVGADAEGHGQHLGELGRSPLGRAGVGDGVAEHHELRPARAEQLLVGLDRPLELIGDRDEQPVTHLTAVGVVDDLEPAELDEDDRGLAIGSLVIGLELAVEQRAPAAGDRAGR